MSTNHETPLEKAKRLAGGPSGLSQKLSELAPGKPITSQAVSQWTRVPPARCNQVSAITGIPVTELRPDIFGAAEQVAS